jgi:hypothetical protein
VVGAGAGEPEGQEGGAGYLQQIVPGAGLEVKADGGEFVVEAMDQIEVEGISHALEAPAVVCDR